MPYLEIIKDGSVIRRQRVPDERAKAGVAARLPGCEPVRMKLGETVRAGEYELRLVQDSTDGSPAPELITSDQAKPRLEGYDLNERLGEGGMGVVWKGIQRSTGRTVAVKFLGQRAFGSDRSRKRFEREVRLSAKLEHPAIVRVYDSGLWHGAYFYTMELIDGLPFDQFIPEQKLSPDDILRVFKLLCDAVQYAHDRGVIHRDLKPGNVLVSKDGNPHVLDFGLAKSLIDDAEENDHHVTMSLEGVATGTPAYMSPEQAAGRHSQTDGRTDVWSIGVMLYRMLVGDPPHDLSGTRFDVTRRIVEEDMRSPRTFGVALGADLEGLLHKALSRNTDDRYSTVGELRDDILNYLNGKPLIARRATLFYLARKRFARHRSVSIASLLLVTLLVCLAFGLRENGWLRARFIQTRFVKVTTAVVAATNPATAPGELAAADLRTLAAQFAAQFDTIKILDPHNGVSQMLSELIYLQEQAKTLVSQDRLPEAADVYHAALALGRDVKALDAKRQALASASNAEAQSSPQDRELAIATLKPLLPFCGVFNISVKDNFKPENPAYPGIAIGRMRFGGTVFTMEDVETLDGARTYRDITILYRSSDNHIEGSTFVHGMRRDLSVALDDKTLTLKYGNRAKEIQLNPDGTLIMRLTEPGTGTLFMTTTATPGWPDKQLLPTFQLDPFTDPLSDPTVAPPTSLDMTSQIAAPLIRADFAARNRDWAETSDMLQLIMSDYANSPLLDREALPLFAWEHLVADEYGLETQSHTRLSSQPAYPPTKPSQPRTESSPPS